MTRFLNWLFPRYTLPVIDYRSRTGVWMLCQHIAETSGRKRWWR